MQPILSTQACRTSIPHFDPGSRDFRPKRFIQHSLQSLSHSELECNLVNDVSEARLRSGQALKELIRDNLGVFIKSRDVMRRVYTTDKELFTGAALQQMAEAFEAACETCNDLVQPAMEFRQGAQSSRATRKLIDAMFSVLSVPGTLYACCGVRVATPRSGWCAAHDETATTTTTTTTTGATLQQRARLGVLCEGSVCDGCPQHGSRRAEARTPGPPDAARRVPHEDGVSTTATNADYSAQFYGILERGYAMEATTHDEDGAAGETISRGVRCRPNRSYRSATDGDNEAGANHATHAAAGDWSARDATRNVGRTEHSQNVQAAAPAGRHGGGGGDTDDCGSDDGCCCTGPASASAGLSSVYFNVHDGEEVINWYGTPLVRRAERAARRPCTTDMACYDGAMCSLRRAMLYVEENYDVLTGETMGGDDTEKDEIDDTCASRPGGDDSEDHTRSRSGDARSWFACGAAPTPSERVTNTRASGGASARWRRSGGGSEAYGVAESGGRSCTAVTASGGGGDGEAPSSIDCTRTPRVSFLAPPAVRIEGAGNNETDDAAGADGGAAVQHGTSDAAGAIDSNETVHMNDDCTHCGPSGHDGYACGVPVLQQSTSVIVTGGILHSASPPPPATMTCHGQIMGDSTACKDAIRRLFIYRYTAALLRAALRLQHRLAESLRYAHTRDVTCVEDTLSMMMEVAMATAKLRHFALTLQRRLHACHPYASADSATTAASIHTHTGSSLCVAASTASPSPKQCLRAVYHPVQFYLSVMQGQHTRRACVAAAELCAAARAWRSRIGDASSVRPGTHFLSRPHRHRHRHSCLHPSNRCGSSSSPVLPAWGAYRHTITPACVDPHSITSSYRTCSRTVPIQQFLRRVGGKVMSWQASSMCNAQPPAQHDSSHGGTVEDSRGNRCINRENHAETMRRHAQNDTTLAEAQLARYAEWIVHGFAPLQRSAVRVRINFALGARVDMRDVIQGSCDCMRLHSRDLLSQLLQRTSSDELVMTQATQLRTFALQCAEICMSQLEQSVVNYWAGAAASIHAGVFDFTPREDSVLHHILSRATGSAPDAGTPMQRFDSTSRTQRLANDMRDNNSNNTQGKRSDEHDRVRDEYMDAEQDDMCHCSPFHAEGADAVAEVLPPLRFLPVLSSSSSSTSSTTAARMPSASARPLRTLSMSAIRGMIDFTATTVQSLLHCFIHRSIVCVFLRDGMAQCCGTHDPPTSVTGAPHTAATGESAAPCRACTRDTDNHTLNRNNNFILALRDSDNGAGDAYDTVDEGEDETAELYAALSYEILLAQFEHLTHAVTAPVLRIKTAMRELCTNSAALPRQSGGAGGEGVALDELYDILDSLEQLREGCVRCYLDGVGVLTQLYVAALPALSPSWSRRGLCGGAAPSSLPSTSAFAPVAHEVATRVRARLSRDYVSTELCNKLINVVAVVLDRALPLLRREGEVWLSGPTVPKEPVLSSTRRPNHSDSRGRTGNGVVATNAAAATAATTDNSIHDHAMMDNGIYASTKDSRDNHARLGCTSMTMDSKAMDEEDEAMMSTTMRIHAMSDLVTKTHAALVRRHLAEHEDLLEALVGNVLLGFIDGLHRKCMHACATLTSNECEEDDDDAAETAFCADELPDMCAPVSPDCSSSSSSSLSSLLSTHAATTGLQEYGAEEWVERGNIIMECVADALCIPTTVVPMLVEELLQPCLFALVAQQLSPFEPDLASNIDDNAKSSDDANHNHADTANNHDTNDDEGSHNLYKTNKEAETRSLGDTDVHAAVDARTRDFQTRYATRVGEHCQLLVDAMLSMYVALPQQRLTALVRRMGFTFPMFDWQRVSLHMACRVRPYVADCIVCIASAQEAVYDINQPILAATVAQRLLGFFATTFVTALTTNANAFELSPEASLDFRVYGTLLLEVEGLTILGVMDEIMAYSRAGAGEGSAKTNNKHAIHKDHRNGSNSNDKSTSDNKNNDDGRSDEESQERLSLPLLPELTRGRDLLRSAVDALIAYGVALSTTQQGDTSQGSARANRNVPLGQQDEPRYQTLLQQDSENDRHAGVLRMSVAERHSLRTRAVRSAVHDLRYMTEAVGTHLREQSIFTMHNTYCHADEESEGSGDGSGTDGTTTTKKAATGLNERAHNRGSTSAASPPPALHRRNNNNSNNSNSAVSAPSRVDAAVTRTIAERLSRRGGEAGFRPRQLFAAQEALHKSNASAVADDTPDKMGDADCPVVGSAAPKRAGSEIHDATLSVSPTATDWINRTTTNRHTNNKLGNVPSRSTNDDADYGGTRDAMKSDGAVDVSQTAAHVLNSALALDEGRGQEMTHTKTVPTLTDGSATTKAATTAQEQNRQRREERRRRQQQQQQQQPPQQKTQQRHRSPANELIFPATCPTSSTAASFNEPATPTAVGSETTAIRRSLRTPCVVNVVGAATATSSCVPAATATSTAVPTEASGYAGRSRFQRQGVL